MNTYFREYEVSVHDTDPKGIAKPSAILRYFQETAYRQMTDQKPTYMELFAENKAFIVSRIVVKMRRSLGQYEKLHVKTWPCEGRGVAFERGYRMYCGDEVVGEAMSVWALINPVEKTFWKHSDVDFSNYVFGDKLDLPDLKLKLPDVPMTLVGERTILYSDTDCNHHMNNTNYPDMLVNYIPDIENSYVSEFSIHYASDAPYLATVKIYRSDAIKEDDHLIYYFRTEKESGVNIIAKMVVKKC